jgi:hypothetical protein
MYLVRLSLVVDMMEIKMVPAAKPPVKAPAKAGTVTYLLSLYFQTYHLHSCEASGQGARQTRYIPLPNYTLKTNYLHSGQTSYQSEGAGQTWCAFPSFRLIL